MTTKDPAQTTEPETGEEAGDRDPAWYREQIATVTGKLDTAVAKLERLAFADLGITDTESGVGKALKLTFEGEIDPEDTAALKEAATEFGWQAEVTAPPETTAKPDVSDAEGRIGQLEKVSEPADPDPLKDEGAKALAEGDIDGAIGSFVAQQQKDGTIDLGGPSQQ